jgi:DNA-binding winged helix-turn-helix (wHTH) protein
VVYRFGTFVLDYDTRQLLRDGTEIRVSPKAFELLTLLVRNRHRAVSKGELQETLWPSTFVEETNLAGLAAEIRRALDDSATHPAFLRTMHRFGYRFVADVIESGAAPPADRRPCLVVDARTVMLLDGANVIGRAPDATIQCERAGVSRHHARVTVSKDGVTLDDLGSKNGTYVGGNRVESAVLSDGDQIRIGTATLTFRTEPPLGQTETLPHPADVPPDDPAAS